MIGFKLAVSSPPRWQQDLVRHRKPTPLLERGYARSFPKCPKPRQDERESKGKSIKEARASVGSTTFATPNSGNINFANFWSELTPSLPPRLPRSGFLAHLTCCGPFFVAKYTMAGVAK